EERQHGLERGAFSYLRKPLTTDDIEVAFNRIKRFIGDEVRHLLVVEDNEIEQMSIVELLSHDDVEIDTVGTGAEALDAMRNKLYDCVVLDLRLPDISGFDLLTKIQSETELRDIPIVVFTGKELSTEEETQLRKMAKSIVLKGVQSPERLL